MTDRLQSRRLVLSIIEEAERLEAHADALRVVGLDRAADKISRSAFRIKDLAEEKDSDDAEQWERNKALQEDPTQRLMEQQRVLINTLGQMLNDKGST